MEGEGGGAVVGCQLDQETSTGAVQPDPHLHPYHPRPRREGERHFEVGGRVEACRRGGRGTAWSRPARITLAAGVLQAADTVAPHPAPAGARRVLWAAASCVGVAVHQRAKIQNLWRDRVKVSCEGRKYL